MGVFCATTGLAGSLGNHRAYDQGGQVAQVHPKQALDVLLVGRVQ